MHQYIVMRTGYLILTLFIASVFTFCVVNAIPGEPAEVLAKHLFLGLEESAPPELIAEVSARYDLNKPLIEQYSEWIRGILSGNLGNSIIYNKSVGKLLELYLPPTILLTSFAMTFAIITGIALGIASALHQNKTADHLIRFITIFSISMPSFWVAVMLILIFSLWLNLTPVAGYGEPKYIILPLIALGLHSMASIARIMRTSMLDTMEKPFIIFSKAKGLSRKKILFSHAFKNAFLPVLTVIGMSFGSLLAGSVIIETIFTWPGIGALLMKAISARDLVVIESTIMVIVFMFLIVNFVIDILYHVIDPRITYE
ncbi:binding-protein-dependent transport systems inner membrane component [Methanospirillum hungatei JF-1]|uniref:Binding-protein-dependent transport systems inner membrane component n=1 Tax=Methanospirillum hungatei JF-1 (strain ATCC 27890 / DSM 864 / NBRC 100397 / JF-1) TaxID=323259 RepID=Q2FMZ9_METHJ|nr:ABC transporter permease [Methanospirillum hungatei]ABD39988.1 binding-protein-dependent transport systems inner membrane component [Methanospirillum hungatei JF-1]MCA1916296.1 ABC transporter permease [Methanospirillum hungatei]